MTIEEKAKAFDEALERAKKLKETCDNTTVVGWMEYIFPDFAESEDERIRKRIIDALHGDILNMEETNKAIAWLEKQGEQKPTEAKPIVKLYERIRNLGVCIDKAIRSENVKDIVSYLEHAKIYGRKALDIIQKYPSNEVKPRFKVGDWITDGYVGGQITSIEYAYPCYKIADFMGGINTSIPFTVQDNYHLWTIQDAKDGDVLVDENVNVIGIFEGIEGMCWHSKLYYSSFTKELYGIECGGSHQKEFAKPATKEQRDLLFQKMKEAGYSFDFENKELKKLTQSVTKISDKVWSEEDDMERKRIIGLLEGWLSTFKETCYAEDCKCGIVWLKSLKERCIWKPTKEHVKAVRLARSFVTDDFGEHPMLSEILIDLEEQLKKLREE